MQPCQQLLVDVVEAPVTKNCDDVLRPQHRNDSIDNRIGILLVKRRVTRFGNRIHDRVWI